MRQVRRLLPFAILIFVFAGCGSSSSSLRYRQSVRRSRKRLGSLGAVKCAAGAAFSPAGGAVILRTLAHVRVGDAALQADTAVLRALRKDTL